MSTDRQEEDVSPEERDHIVDHTDRDEGVAFIFVEEGALSLENRVAYPAGETSL